MTFETLPTYVSADRTLRVKILDACGFTCTFCHNEGTPVRSDNRNAADGVFVDGGASGRRSIYLASNGADFVPAPMRPDAAFSETLAALIDRMGYTEVHFTGGEPTLHPALSRLITKARHLGLRVGVTSNGENPSAIPYAARAGLDRINFSVFGTTPGELAQVQHERLRRESLAARKIDALRASIDACIAHGVKASANIVVLNDEHVERVHRLLDEYSPRLSVRLLNSLDHGDASIAAIERILAERGAVAEERHVTAGASGERTAYRLPHGRRIWFKQIRPVRLPKTCLNCRFNNDRDCQEGFYGVRLYYTAQQTYQVGVCIQRMDLCMSVSEFIASELADEVLRLRSDELDALQTTVPEPRKEDEQWQSSARPKSWTSILTNLAR